MLAFAHAIDSIASSAKRLEKIVVLAHYLVACSDEDLDAAARFLSGSLLPAGERLQAAIGSRTLTAAAAQVFGFTSDRLREQYRAHGDISEAIASCYAPSLDLGLFAEQLTPAMLLARMRRAAQVRGKQANGARQTIVEQIFRACTSAREVAAIVKVITGELRIGAREGLIVEAIAQAFGRPVEDVRRAFAANVDAGIVAVAAKHDDLREIKPAYGTPLGFMLASPMVYRSEYKDVTEGAWLLEDKFDGIRAQIHIEGTEVKIFSRAGGDITQSFPELREACAHNVTAACMLDGEIVASANGRPLPFRLLQPRLARKSPSPEMQAEIRVTYVAFDILAMHNAMLIDEPLHERRERLERLGAAWDGERMTVAEAFSMPAHDAERIEAMFAAARARGNEGLMLKRTDSLYTPGRRGKSWMKLKQELDTLDVVVVGVEWGHGKRAKMLSDYTFAVQGEHGLLTIGKAYSGLTDAEIIELTPWFLSKHTGALGKRALAVEPELVIEIAFDILAPSDRNESGFSLRFPRIVRIRKDKSIHEINTLSDVKNIYQLMLERERHA